MPLSDSACRSAAPGKHFDGGGLYLDVTPGKKRVWRLAYRFDGKQRKLTVGQYPAISLAAARQRREGVKVLLAEGKNPAMPEDDGRPFREVADEWVEQQSDRWKTTHRERVMTRIRQDVLPALGDRGMGSITPRDVLDAVRAVEGRGSLHVARRVHQAIRNICAYAVVNGDVTANPATDLRGALKAQPRVRHRASLKPEAIPEFMVKLDAYDGDPVTRLAIELTLRTMLRTGEVRFGAWSEIEGDLWRIPAERMKVWGLEHLVPLPPQVLRVLEDLRRYGAEGSPWVVNIAGKPPSENTMLYALYRMGYHGRLTIHGLRGTASTVLNESGLFREDWVERQLAHFPRDSVRAAYNAAEYLPHRVEMMRWWNNYLDACYLKGAFGDGGARGCR